MPTLYITVGLPASGKSTWCKKQNAFSLSADDIREKIYGNAETQGNPKEVFSLLYFELSRKLKEGKDVIADITGMTKWERKAALDALGKYADKKVCVWFDVPEEVCKERNQKRERKVPEFVYERMVERFEKPFLEEGFDEIIVIKERSAEKC